MQFSVSDSNVPATSGNPKMLPPGVVTVEELRDGWYQVAIGRDRYVKRFNVSRGEAAELVRLLAPLLPETRTGDAR